MSPRAEFIALVAGVGAAALLLIFTFLNFEFFFMLFFGVISSAGTFLGITFLPKYPVREVRAEPEAALAYLANRLRLSGYRVAESPGKLTVRIGSFSAILVGARQTAFGCRVHYQPYATASGWGTLLTLLIIVYTGLIGLALAVYGFLRAWSFAASKLAPLLPLGGILPEIPPDERTRSLLAEALSEAYRSAAEAEEALHSDYWNFQALVWGGAIVAWLLLFLALSLGDPNPDVIGRMTMSGLRAAAFVAAAAIPIGALIRVRLRPRVLAYREQSRRLRAALSRASAPMPSEAGAPSAFEVLMDSAVDVPSWIEAARRGGLNRDPAAGLLILIAAVWTISLVSGAVSLVFFDPLLAALLALVGIALSVGATLFYRRWKRRWDEETERNFQDWRRRIEEVRARMDRYIEDL